MVSPAAGGPVYRHGLEGQRPGQAAAAPPEDLHPEVREPIAGPGEGAGPPTTRQGGRGDMCCRSDLAEECGEIGRSRVKPGAPPLGTLRLRAQCLDELRPAQHSFVGGVRLPAPTEGLHRQPTAHTPQESASLQIRTAALGHSRGDEGAILSFSPPRLPAEAAQYGSGILPRDLPRPTKGGVTAVGVLREGTEVWHDPGPERIQVEVADQFEKIGLHLDDDGLVPVLEEVAGPPMAAVEDARVPREEGPHAPGEGAGARPDQEMEMVWEEGPRVDRERPYLDQACHPAHEVVPIPVVPEDRLSIQSPGHYVVEDPGGIEAWATRHNDAESITRLIRLQRPVYV